MLLLKTLRGYLPEEGERKLQVRSQSVLTGGILRKSKELYFFQRRSGDHKQLGLLDTNGLSGDVGLFIKKNLGRVVR